MPKELVSFWSNEIAKDFPNLSPEKLKGIIIGGIKGEMTLSPRYGIGLSTVYSWIKEKHREEGKSYAELMMEDK